MNFLSICSGIEAASVAWKPLGWRATGFSEIEPFPSAVLAHHYPDVPNHGDMTKFKDWKIDEPIDLVCGGTPCQAFSIAGLRQGLADPRGNLSLTFLAIVDRFRPRWVVWENVPGVLSSNGGRDFGSFLGGLGQLGYGWAYRVLDAQFIRVDGYPRAVPQRRRRVVVIGYIGGWAGAAAVLSEPESLLGNTPPRREAGQGTSRDVAQSLVSSGRGVERAGETRGQDPVTAVTSTGDVSHCLNAGGMGRFDYETETMIAHTLRGEGFDASEDGSGRGTPIVPVKTGYQGDSLVTPSMARPCLGAQGGNNGGRAGAILVQPVAFSSKDHGADAAEGVSPTLRSGGHDKSHANAGVPPAIAIQERAVAENPNSGPDGKGYRDDGAAYTLEARSVQQAVAFDMRGRDGGAMPEGPHDTANIRAADGGSSRSYVAQPFSIMPMNSGKDYKARPTDVAQPVMAGGPVGGNQGGDYVAEQWAVRRLTPTECHRLQGFPDGYCNIPWRGKDHAPDGPQYKALGNSWAVNMFRWVGMRLQLVDDALKELDAEKIPEAAE